MNGQGPLALPPHDNTGEEAFVPPLSDSPAHQSNYMSPLALPPATSLFTADEKKAPAVSNKQVFKDDRYYSGDKAVMEVERRVGRKLEPRFRDLVKEEGFFAGKYFDDRAKNPVKTAGVGQTGKYIDMPLTEVFKEQERELTKAIPSYNDQREEVKSALLSAKYRGDMKPGFKWVKLFNQGKFKQAADELLDHKEYRERKAKNKNDGVVKRLDHISNTLRSMK